MPYCSQCGVEVKPDVDFCPLCHAPIQHLDKNNSGKFFPDRTEIHEESIQQIKKNLKAIWVTLSIILSISFFVFLVITLKYPQERSWVGYPMLSIVAFWTYVTIFFFLLGKPVLFGSLFFLNTAAFLFSLDFMYKATDWFFPIGLPILVSFMFFTIVFTIFTVKIKSKGYNIIGLFFICIALFCDSIDLIIIFRESGKFDITWSSFIIVTLIPLGLFFFYLHYGLKKHLKFDRIFHL